MAKTLAFTVNTSAKESLAALKSILVNTYGTRDFNRVHCYGIDVDSSFSTDISTIDDTTDDVATIEEWADRWISHFTNGGLMYLALFDEYGLPKSKQVHVLVETRDEPLGMASGHAEDEGVEVVSL